MEKAYRYEAAVLGDDLAALFAGYLLKKYRIRFIILNADGFDPQKLGAERRFPYEISEENKKIVSEIYRKVLAQVGISEKELIDSALSDTDGDKCLDTFLMADRDKERLKTFLMAELEEELRDRNAVTDIVYTADMQDTSDSRLFEGENDGFIVLKCGTQIIETDVFIHQQDIFTAGTWAQAVLEEKQRRLEESMKRLRIKAGKRTPRKMVYVTHSKSWFYAREAVMQFAVEQGAAPVNPFMNYGFYLNGAVEKDEITECCHQFIRTADELWVFGPISEAILTDIAVAVMEGKEVRFFSISEHVSKIHELQTEEIIFEREVHAGQIRKSDLLNFVGSTAPKGPKYVQMSLFD